MGSGPRARRTRFAPARDRPGPDLRRGAPPQGPPGDRRGLVLPFQVGWSVGGDATLGRAAFGLLDLGLGVAFGALSIVPEVAVPLGFKDAETTFGVGVSLALGRRPRSASVIL